MFSSVRREREPYNSSSNNYNSFPSSRSKDGKIVDKPMTCDESCCKLKHPYYYHRSSVDPESRKYKDHPQYEEFLRHLTIFSPIQDKIELILFPLCIYLADQCSSDTPMHCTSEAYWENM